MVGKYHMFPDSLRSLRIRDEQKNKKHTHTQQYSPRRVGAEAFTQFTGELRCNWVQRVAYHVSRSTWYRARLRQSTKNS